MKENEKNFKLIEELSALMNKLDISTLNYKFKELKLKIKKSPRYSPINEEDKTVLDNKEKNKQKISENKIESKIEFTSDHPGAIKSPMVGTAYSSPEPGKSPFITLGEKVKKGHPLVIIEAMKVMNTINSDRNGKVVFIGFEDAQPVEFDQLLVIIE